MAFVRIEYCRTCKKEVYHTNSACDDCVAREKTARISAWQALPLNDKLEDIRKRLERLER